MTQFAVDKIDPNPFRSKYPYDEKKIAALMASIRNTEVWPTVCGRMVAGRIQLAFGHHRLEAARRLKLATFPVNAAAYSDEAMLKMLANENSADYQQNQSIDMETIRAVVLAYHQGKIALPKVDKKGPVRAAPRFGVVSRTDIGSRDPISKPYTSDGLVEFLGWSDVRVGAALLSLAQIEAGRVDEDTFDRLSQLGARTVHQVVNQLERDLGKGDEARPAIRAAAKAAADAIREGQDDREGYRRKTDRGIAARDVPKVLDVARKTLPSHLRTKRELPDVDLFVQQLTKRIKELLRPGESLTLRLEEVIASKAYVSEVLGSELVEALSKLAKRANDYARKLEHCGGAQQDGKDGKKNANALLGSR